MRPIYPPARASARGTVLALPRAETEIASRKGRLSMKRSIISFAFSSTLAFGCAGGINRGAQAVTARGTVTMAGPLTRAVLRGPAVVHAYASTSAPSLFAAPLVSGTDADCRAQPGGAHAITPGAEDYARLTLTVQPGEVLCITTTSRRHADDVLWHAHRGSRDEGAMALR
jgi:hypothetical protein